MYVRVTPRKNLNNLYPKFQLCLRIIFRPCYISPPSSVTAQNNEENIKRKPSKNQKFEDIWHLPIHTRVDTNLNTVQWEHYRLIIMMACYLFMITKTYWWWEKKIIHLFQKVPLQQNVGISSRIRLQYKFYARKDVLTIWIPFSSFSKNLSLEVNTYWL